ncbi:hypothetical protein CY35_14G026400 [Sphagnum magellanicum]|nr:hypothetical protein CY35_14G026400 [Sphagnum magellanicum]
MVGVTLVWIAVVVAIVISVDIVFAVTGSDYPFCLKRRLEHMRVGGDSERDPGIASYAFTEEEAVQYYWAAVFLPTSVVFTITVIYLFAGMSVAYSAPERHGCLRVVENNWCASKRGGVRCLATLNLSFLIVFMMLAIFLGSSILTLGTECSRALFWCYEVICLGMVTLLGTTAVFLQRKAAVIMDAGEWYGNRSTGVELLEATAVTPEMERRINTGFKTWMGPADSLSSSDDEESGLQPTSHGLDDVWEEDASDMYDAREELSRSMVA